MFRKEPAEPPCSAKNELIAPFMERGTGTPKELPLRRQLTKSLCVGVAGREAAKLAVQL